jgi:phosphatidate cytidylyltransferase
VDERLEPWSPFLFVLLVLLAGIACFELLHLLPESRRPRPWLCFASVGVTLAVNWVALVAVLPVFGDHDPWHGITLVLAALTLAAFLVEMANFREPGEAVTRIALTIWIVAYLGLLPSFLAQLRWHVGALGLALAIFVPKSCDIGAYFTGRFLGKHPMAPVLSPKKTWEGAVGGIATAVLVTIGINRMGTPLLRSISAETGFGLTVGMAGMLGDLAESLIKRDCRHKDASQVVPGFGGVLDVVDAIIFAAPVSYCWLH